MSKLNLTKKQAEKLIAFDLTIGEGQYLINDWLTMRAEIERLNKEMMTKCHHLKEAVEEIANAECKYEKIFNEYETSYNQFQPKKYWEGLVSGFKSDLIILRKHFPELEEK